jgi:hypothetical protein
VAWPEQPFGDVDVRVELEFDGTGITGYTAGVAWQDVTVFVDGDVLINRGLSPNASSRLAEPASVELQLLNDDFRFSVDDPRSLLFGRIGRGTKLRVRVVYNSGLSTSTRFTGKIRRLPSTPDDRHGDLKVTVTVQASGVLGDFDLVDGVGESPLSRHFRSVSGLLGYWSLEDGGENAEGGASFGSWPVGAGRVTVTGGRMGDRDATLVASDPVPALGTARLRAATKRSPFIGTTGNAWTLMAHMVIPTSIPTTSSAVAVECNGSAHDWYIQVKDDGTAALVIGDINGALIGSSSPTTDFRGQSVRFRVAAEQSGTDVTWSWSYLVEGATAGVSLGSGTLTAYTNGRPKAVTWNFDGVDAGDVVVAHVAVLDGVVSVTAGAEAFAGHAGENAAARVVRLATEAGTGAFTDPITSTTLLGPQRRAPAGQLLEDVVDCDGMVFDQRTQLALTYLGFAARVDPTEVVIPYSDLALPVRVEPSDARVVNDVTVTRAGGAAARVEVTDGPLGVTALGRKDTAVTLNLFRDSQPVHHANLMTVIGTWPEPRIPAVSIDVYTASTATRTAVLDGSLDIGARMVLPGLPAALGGQELRQILEGYTERLSRVGWWWTGYGSPAGPFDWVVLDDPVLGRIDQGASTLAAAVTSTATTLSVAFVGPPWGRAADGVSFPFDLLLGGVERVTVLAITGTTSPQPFTVVRGVGGKQQAHVIGAEVRLFRQRRWGL